MKLSLKNKHNIEVPKERSCRQRTTRVVSPSWKEVDRIENGLPEGYCEMSLLMLSRLHRVEVGDGGRIRDQSSNSTEIWRPILIHCERVSRPHVVQGQARL